MVLFEYLYLQSFGFTNLHAEHYFLYFLENVHLFVQQGTAALRQEELDGLTKKLVYDMNHPPTEEYLGTFLFLIKLYVLCQ